MKKFSLILLFILGSFVVFAVSAVITFTLTLDRGGDAPEEATEAVYTGGANLSVENEIEAEVAVTRVTPSLSVADAIIVRTVYGAKVEESEKNYEMPEAEVVEDDVDLSLEDEAEVKPAVEEKKEEVKAEAPKVEEKKEDVKAVEPKAEEKKEEVKAEAPKVEEKKEEVKAEEPVVEEKKEEVKVEAPKAEEKKEVVLDPNKQYSDTGL